MIRTVVFILGLLVAGLLSADPLSSFDPAARIPWEGGPAHYSRCTYQWFVYNTGQSIDLFQDGAIASSTPAATSASIHLIEALNACPSANGILVAVIDTGLNYLHPDLAGCLWSGQVPSSAISDYSGHGTAMAGVIAATANNGIGISGVALGVKLLIERTSLLHSSDVIPSIYDAVTSGAKIINCSWGFGDNNASLLDAFRFAQSNGVICVCSGLDAAVDYNGSLNDYPIKWRKTASNPGGLDNLIAVTASMPDDTILSGGAAWGRDYVDFAAPGYAIPTCGWTTNYPYVYSNGTSIAAAITSGATALVWAAHPEESHLQIIDRLVQSVDRSAAGLLTATIGGGRLNVYRAITMQWPSVAVLDSIESGATTLAASNLITGKSYSIQNSPNLVAWVQTYQFVAPSNSLLYTTIVSDSQFFRLAY